MNPIELKRQILEQSDQSGIRKKILAADTGLKNDEIIEMGLALEDMTKTKGFAYLEAYILKTSNPIGLLMSGTEDSAKMGESRALIRIIQYINEVIKAKDEILRRQDAERKTTKNKED